MSVKVNYKKGKSKCYEHGNELKKSWRLIVLLLKSKDFLPKFWNQSKILQFPVSWHESHKVTTSACETVGKSEIGSHYAQRYKHYNKKIKTVGCFQRNWNNCGIPFTPMRTEIEKPSSSREGIWSETHLVPLTIESDPLALASCAVCFRMKLFENSCSVRRLSKRAKHLKRSESEVKWTRKEEMKQEKRRSVHLHGSCFEFVQIMRKLITESSSYPELPLWAKKYQQPL